MTRLDAYATAFSCVRMERRDGVLLMRFHTDGGSLRWGLGPQRELGEAFAAVASDVDNRVVIMTGTGDEFSGPVGSKHTFERSTPRQWDSILRAGLALTRNLLAIPVPVISAVNGPAVRHAEIPLMADIVLASESAVFQDSAHFPNRLVPGDGINLVTPLLMGLNRARYFHLTGQVLDAGAAREAGLVNEVLPPEGLLDRAWELARQLAGNNDMVLRYSRLLLTQQLRVQVESLLALGLALEGLGNVDETSSPEGHRWDEPTAAS